MRGDDRESRGWQKRDSQARGPNSMRGMVGRRGALLGLVALGTLVAIVLLTVCLTSALIPLLTQVLATAPSASPSVVATQQATAIPATETATAASGSADWDTFTLYDGGFRVDVPGVLGSSHGYFINDFSGQGVDLAYNGATLSTPLQRLEAGVKVSVLYSTKVTNINICPQGGTPIQAGAGNVRISAWQRDQGDTVYVNLVLNGVAIEIHMTSRSGQPALPQYAEIWTHMLASIAPLPGQPVGATHPCG
ncbi:MAG TPA: hypothetical protein VHR15_00290 [Ktedonobacterales bacterium]|nr:hypothetical protein [Ktedonobacterales bacterium]